MLSPEPPQFPFVALLVVVPAFFLFGALVHALLARFAITPFNSLLVTFGLTVMIESGIQWKWSADYRRLESAYGGIKFKIGELFVPLTDLVTLGLAVVLAFGIWAALRYTDLGRALRASAEDPQMAAAFSLSLALSAASSWSRRAIMSLLSIPYSCSRPGSRDCARSRSANSSE